MSVVDIKESLYRAAADTPDDAVISSIRQLLSDETETSAVLSTVDEEGYTLLEHAVASRREKVRLAASNESNNFTI